MKVKVAATLGNGQAVVNRGARDGLRVGQELRFGRRVIDVRDPDSGDSLGEIVRYSGTLVVEQILERIAVCKVYWDRAHGGPAQLEIGQAASDED